MVRQVAFFNACSTLTWVAIFAAVSCGISHTHIQLAPDYAAPQLQSFPAVLQILVGQFQCLAWFDLASRLDGWSCVQQ